METLLQDIRYGTRILYRSPGFSAVAILSLALGIGANTTIFSVFNTTILGHLPLKDPEQLVLLFENNLEQGNWRSPTFAIFSEWEKQNQVFDDLAETDFGGGPMTMVGAGETVRISVGLGSLNRFSVLGVAPIMGRTFLPSDFPPPYSSTILLSHGFWQRHLGADPNVLGRTVTLEGDKKTIIGVMPPGFWVLPWAKDVDAWLAKNNSRYPDRRIFSPIARLKPGVTIDQAQAEMDIIAQRLEQSYPETQSGWGTRVESLHDYAVGGYRQPLHLLMGAVAFILLIACANVGNLLLARAASRHKEIAVRASLGASRLRILRQMLTESSLLALLGGVAGVLLTFWGIRIFVTLAPSWFGRATEMSIDATVLGFTLAISLVAGMVFGLVPSLQASKPDLNESLKEAGRRSGGGSGGRMQGILVVIEVALALLLLVGAGLMVNSFLRLQNVDLGFNPENLLTADILLAGPKYWQQTGERLGKALVDVKKVTPQGARFYEQVLERLEAHPEVVSASIAYLAPPAGGAGRLVRIEGQPAVPPQEQRRASYCEVSPKFFRTMGIPLSKGRLLSERDVEGSPWVAVINETMARQFFPDEDPIGRRLQLSIDMRRRFDLIVEERPREIVGVVGDVRQWGSRWDPRATMYGSYRQHPWDYPGGGYTVHLWKDLVIRTKTEPLRLAPVVRKIVAEIDKDQAVYDIKSMEQALSETVSNERFWMRLFGIFAALAVILAAVGIYGVMSYSVSQRTHEIGVRVAMGAHKRNVLKLVIRQGLKLTVIGLAIGLAGSFWLTALIARYLYGVTPTDPFTLAAVSILLVAVAVAACYFPARWATKVDPLAALRHE